MNSTVLTENLRARERMGVRPREREGRFAYMYIFFKMKNDIYHSIHHEEMRVKLKEDQWTHD